MTTGPDLRIATLNDARSRRSAEKRAAVEDAIMRPVSYTHLTLPTIYSV